MQNFVPKQTNTFCMRQGKRTVMCHNSSTQFVLSKYSDEAALENAVTVVAFCLTSG